ncbi:MAG: hypothetical protein WED04_09805 [Promethearchaeati archaeon SRVP18_Atabeyarchaeia-1]
MAKKTISLASKNKFFSLLLIMTIAAGTSTFLLAPAQYANPQLGVISVQGKGSFDLNAYPVLDRRVIGLLNLFRDYYGVTDLSNSSVNDLSMLPPFMTQYFLAFTTYGMAKIADSTPGYRTSYYTEVFHKLIAMMNSSAMEQLEWISPDFTNANYSLLGNSFRGPTNIMWTGHYALMELLYYSLFHDSIYNSEIESYMDQWNATLTANVTWDGNPSNGLGRWGVGLIPCEPFIVFVQCNCIPFYAMRLYDKLHGTNYQQATLPGISWWEANMIDPRGIPVDGYYIRAPLMEHRGSDAPQSYPGPALTRGTTYPKVSAYGSAWTTMFYNAMGMTALANELYGNWKGAFVHYSTEDTAYVVDSYYYPHDFSLSEYVGNVFALFCAREMGDQALFRKLENWFYSPFEASWSGYKYSFDTSVMGSLSSFAFPVINVAWAWCHASSTLTDLMNPRNDTFFAKPYISNQSTTDGLFIYQAYYDTARAAFILTLETASNVVLTFSNFPSVQNVYTAQGTYANWTQNGSQMLLTLTPGSYSFVIA